MLYISTDKNVADIFTKALSKSLFRQHRGALTGFTDCGLSAIKEHEIMTSLDKIEYAPTSELALTQAAQFMDICCEFQL